MGLFNKLFKKDSSEDSSPKQHKGFYNLTINQIEKLTSDCVKITFAAPQEFETEFSFIPGQYLTFIVTINGKEERRSYSICSGTEEALSVAVKAVQNGTVSQWFNQQAEVGMTILSSKPEGNFIWNKNAKKAIAFAAGSGITPILSMLKSAHKNSISTDLYYGSKTFNSIILKPEIDNLNSISKHLFLSQEEMDGFQHGRLDKSTVTELIKKNLDILKADAFYICGPEQMIADISSVLKMFGVEKQKIHFELFTTPTILKSETKSTTIDFAGESKVKVILDGETTEFNLKSDGKPILDVLDKEGVDAPYSCKGGVCSSCKAKVLKGKAIMDLNYVLTDQEVEQGYILTCQAHPASEELIISFDA